MNHPRLFPRLALLPAALLIACSAAHAQDADGAQKAKNLGTVIVTGTRADNRTESSSLTPVDVVSAQLLKQTGTTELSTALARVIPSTRRSTALIRANSSRWLNGLVR